MSEFCSLINKQNATFLGLDPISLIISAILNRVVINISKGRFTRYNFVVCDKLTTSLRHESFRLNLTYNLLAIVAYDTKNVVGFWNMFKNPTIIVGMGNLISRKSYTIFSWREQRAQQKSHATIVSKNRTV